MTHLWRWGQRSLLRFMQMLVCLHTAAVGLLFHLSQDVLTRFNLDSNLDWNLGSGWVVGGGGTRALMQIIWGCEWAQDRCKVFLFGQTWVFVSLLDFIRPGLAGSLQRMKQSGPARSEIWGKTTDIWWKQTGAEHRGSLHRFSSSCFKGTVWMAIILL